MRRANRILAATFVIARTSIAAGQTQPSTQPSMHPSTQPSAPWTFELRKTVVEQAWIGNDAIYLRLPSAARNTKDAIEPTRGLPVLTYPTDAGFSSGPVIAAVDLSSGKLRWARPYLGEYAFALDPAGKDLWAFAGTFDRLDSATGRTALDISFEPKPPPGQEADPGRDKLLWRTVSGIRIDGQVIRSSERSAGGLQSRVYDVDTHDIVDVLAAGLRLPDKLSIVDVAVDQAPELVQTHVQARPISGGNATWRFSTGGYSGNPPVMLGDDVLVLSGTASTVGSVTRLDGRTGTPRWSTRLPHGAYVAKHTQYRSGTYGGAWAAVGTLDADRLYAIGGDGTVYILLASTGQIVGAALVDDVHVGAPRLVNGLLVIAGENRLTSIPLDVALGDRTLPTVTAQLTTADEALAARRFADALAAATAATEFWPLSIDAWRSLERAAIAAGEDDAAVRAGCRVMELSQATSDDWLREKFGLLARIDTGPIHAPIAPLGLMLYAPSMDGELYVIDPTSLAVVERRAMQGDASSAKIRGNDFIRTGDDRRIETLVTVPHVPATPLQDDPLFSILDFYGAADTPWARERLHPPERNVPAAWTNGGKTVGPERSIDGRLVRTVDGGGTRELVGGDVIEHAAVLDGVSEWRIDRTEVGPLGCGKGGVYALDEQFRPTSFLVDLRDEANNYGVPEVLAVDADETSLVYAVRDRQLARRLTIAIRSRDGTQRIRKESVLVSTRSDELEREPSRLFKLGDGYIYAGGELVWLPLDPTKPVWRFRANDDADARRTSGRNESGDRSFGMPRVIDGKLFVGNRYGGVYVFDIARITGQQAS